MIEQVGANVFALLIVLALASYRITRLIVLDEVLGLPPAIDARTGELVPGDRGTGLRRLVDVLLYDEYGDARSSIARWLGAIYTCTFCTGVWVTALVVVAWFNGPAAVQWVLIAAAVAGAQGYVNSRPGS